MSLTRQQRDQAMDWLRDLFDHDAVRLVLSVLIILSVLPFSFIETLSLAFFAVFAVELALRLSLLRHDLRHRALNRVEVVFFLVDVVALLSFLPMELLWDDVRLLRLFRLSRMLLLLGYWGTIVREIWFILMKRERRYQILFVVASALILSFISAILLNHFRTQGVDYNGDGRLGNDGSFWAMLWWSFRQIQDPGNLLQDTTSALAFFFSFSLTIAGMFLFSFFIGIGTSVVEELVALGKERRLGARHHSVICNLGPYSRVLLEELCTYYAKSFRSPRIVTMGPNPARFGYMLEGPLQRIRYRQGRPLNAHDLQRVDADRAKRVILLGHPDRVHSDSQVVSQVLSVRELNPSCDIYAELYRQDNAPAALAAGGEHTVPIFTDQLAGLFLAHITVFPGIQEIYWELLTSLGDEIYTCLLGRGAMADQAPPSGPLLPFGELLERGHRAHGVILLGYLLDDPGAPQGYTHLLNPGAQRADGAPAGVPPVDRLRGLFGVADNFERLKGLVQSLPDLGPQREGGPTPPLPRLAVCPSAADLGRVLICGFHEGLVAFVEQLILLTRGTEILIMVPAAAQVPGVRETFVDRLDGRRRTPGVPPSQLRVQVEADDRLRLEAPQRPGVQGSVRLVVGDWSDERTLLREGPGGLDLQRLDAVLLTYAASDEDPDARTALGLIKLIRLRQVEPGRLKPGLRILCEVQSTEKAELFQRRFARPAAGTRSPCHPVVVVPAERLRNSLLAQSVFVPGLGSIYQELLGEAGQEVCRLLVQGAPAPDDRWSFTRLLGEVHRQLGLLTLAVELQDPGGGNRRVVVNPRRREADHSFLASQLVSLFAVGDLSRLPPGAEPCPGCFAAAGRGCDPPAPAAGTEDAP